MVGHDPPDLERARAAAARVDREGNRAADIINSLRAFYKTGTPGERQLVDVKGTIEEMRVLLQTEAARYSVTIQTELEVGYSQHSGGPGATATDPYEPDAERD